MPPDSLAQQIDALFQEYDRPDAPGCAVGLIQNGAPSALEELTEADVAPGDRFAGKELDAKGALVYAQGYGCADLEHGVPITPTTTFHVASMAKQFTAACIALLEEEGQLDAEADVHTYLPELPDYGETVRLKDLVYMTNGLYDVYSLANFILGFREDDWLTAEGMMDLVCACDWLMFKPGEQWSYGNTGYFLLGQIVQRVTGQVLAEFADRNIFQPLEMGDTFFRDDRAKIIPRRAESYSDYAYVHYNDPVAPYCSRGDRLAINADTLAVPGAGQLWTTVEDLFLWDQNFYHNRLGRGGPDLVRKLTTAGPLNDGRPCGYGYGLFLGEKAGQRYAFHGGSNTGYSAALLRLPDLGISVICLGNHTALYERLDVYPESHSLLEQAAALLAGSAWDGPGAGETTTAPAVEAAADDAAPSAWAELSKAGGAPSPRFVGDDYGIDGAPLTIEISPANRPLGAALAAALPSTTNGAPYADLAGMFQDPASAWFWKITPTAQGLVVEQNMAGRFELQPTGEDTFSGPAGLTCRFKREGDAVRRIVAQQDGQERVYFPFLTSMDAAQLAEYAGRYVCDRLHTAYIVQVQEDGLLLRNADRRRTGVDFFYTPTIRDLFMTYNPPYSPWDAIGFLRDVEGQVDAFVFRDDETSGRERLVFYRLGHR